MISVIVTVYNTERFLRQCLYSICSQTMVDIEIICINDGSSDNSQELLEEFAEKDSRIKVIEQENQGPGAARNVGLSMASGEYVCFIDSDDFLAPTYLEDLYNSAKKNEADIAICNSFEIDDVTQVVSPNCYSIGEYIKKLSTDETFNIKDYPDDFFEQFIGWPWDKLYSLDFLKKNQVLYPNFNNTEDLPFVLLAMSLAKKISYVSNSVVYHRVNNLSSTSNLVRSKNCEIFFDAFKLLKDNLEKHSVYSTAQKPLINWMMVFLKWHYTTLPSVEQQKMQQIIQKLFDYFDLNNLALDLNYFAGNLDKFVTFVTFSNHKYSGKRLSKHDVKIRVLKLKYNLFIKKKSLNKIQYKQYCSCLTDDFWILYCSELFDPNWYKTTFLNDSCSDLDSCLHYLFVGWRKGFNPSVGFDGNYYLLNNVDVKRAGVNPLVHYLRFGQNEKREKFEL